MRPVEAGYPDRLVILPGYMAPYVCFVEVKSEGRKLEPLQVDTVKELRALNCKVYVVDTKRAVDNMLREYLRSMS